MEYSLRHANDNVKLLLKYRGWSQAVLSKKTGMSTVTLARRLNSKNPKWTMTEGISVAKAFGIPVNDIFFTKMVPTGNKAEPTDSGQA